MSHAQIILDKIQYDPKEVKENVLLGYIDAYDGTLIPIKYPDIISIDDGYIESWDNNRILFIPVDMIGIIVKNGEVLWCDKSKVRP